MDIYPEKERRWIFLDKILRFENCCEDTRTIFYLNGDGDIYSGGAAMTGEQVEHLKCFTA